MKVDKNKSLLASLLGSTVSGVFEIGLGVEGKNIILIDDVMTTEATINEAREILEHGGAKVFVVVMAN